MVRRWSWATAPVHAYVHAVHATSPPRHCNSNSNTSRPLLHFSRLTLALTLALTLTLTHP